MGLNLTNKLKAIFLDLTIDGDRVITKKDFTIDENEKKYMCRKRLVVKETGEVLKEELYSSSSRRPYETHISNPYMLA